MRAYINGELSTPQLDTFFLVSFWFANEECEDNTEVSENCIRLDGIWTEGSSENTEFSCKWKGVALCYLNEEGFYLEIENFTLDDFEKMIKEKNMKIVNADGYPSSTVNAKITEFKLVDGEKELVFDTDEIEEIEFII